MTMTEWEETAPETQRCPGTSPEGKDWQDEAMAVLEGLIEDAS
jgi:hypothetical protein